VLNEPAKVIVVVSALPERRSGSRVAYARGLFEPFLAAKNVPKVIGLPLLWDITGPSSVTILPI
jgi:hypothetical protein